MFASKFVFRLVYDDPAPESMEQHNIDDAEPVEEEQPQDRHEDNSSMPEPTKNKKMLSEEEFHKRLNEERRKFQTNHKQLLNDLKGFRESLNMTEEQKQGLEQTIERLQSESMTAAEIAKRDRDKMTREFQAQLDKQRKETELWRNMYTEEKIERDLLDAAISNKAINPNQIKNVLKPQSKLVPELTKDGQPTGKWVPKIAFQDKKEDGEVITLELSPHDTVKRMSEMPDHWNLFNSGANGGLGSFNAPTNTARGTKPPSDPNAFRRWLKENELLKNR